jgi:DNA-binding IclR family transcriptional regulator
VLAQARTAGYFTRPGIIREGTVAVSVPVLGNDDAGLPAALTAVIPEEDAQIPLTVAVLRSASFAISAALKRPPELSRPSPEILLSSRRL